MDISQIRVLVIEDNPAEAKFLKTVLYENTTAKFRVETANRLATGLERLKAGDIDVIMLDLSLPDGQGIDTFRRVQCVTPTVPIIVLTGLDDESVALEAVKSGAQDYLVKGEVPPTWLARAIRYAIQRKLAEERIRQLNSDLERRVIELAQLNTELDELSRSLTLARDQAIQASNFKSEFVAKMSHEVRTPVSAVAGMIELLLNSSLTDEQREFAVIINDSIQSLLSVLNEILDFSKVEAGKIDLEIIDLSPVSMVEGTAELLAATARKKGLALLTFIDPSIPPVVKGDPIRLRQILLNLASNAIKFTDQGEVVLRATLESQDDTSMNIRFAVGDTGSGIPEQVAAQLFKPYVQADTSSLRKHQGTGLGLSICKRLVELMGGQIGVESKEGKGSNFWFSVRLQAAAGVHIGTGTTSLAWGTELKRARILIVDDSFTARDILLRYLKAAGFRCSTAANADEALDILRYAESVEDPYDIAIIDLSSYSEASNELASDIHGDPTLSATRLILLTAFDEQGKAEQAWKAGFAAYLTKPVKQSLLTESIVEVMHGTPAKFAQAGDSPRQTIIQPVQVDSSRSILLAEDNPALQQVVVKQLSKLGLTVNVVANGQEAVKAFSDTDFAFVIMDCQMPGMNGIEAAKAIRQMERGSGKHIPIIAMTASVLQRDRESCMEAGMDDYVCKPVSMDQLQQLIVRWIPKTNLDKQASSMITLPSDLVDIRQLQDSFDDEGIIELIPLFISEQERLLVALKLALENEDHRIAGRLLHELKGVGSSLMAEPLAKLCSEFEDIIKQEKTSLTPKYYDSLEQMCSALATYFTQFLERSTPKCISNGQPG